MIYRDSGNKLKLQNGNSFHCSILMFTETLVLWAKDAGFCHYGKCLMFKIISHSRPAAHMVNFIVFLLLLLLLVFLFMFFFNTPLCILLGLNSTMSRATKVFLVLYTIVLLLITIHWLSPFYILKFDHVKGSRNILNDQENNLPPLIAEKDVVVLSEKNFSHVVAKNRYVIVNFYAPWSYYSQQLAPEYALAATELKGEVVLAKVDAYEEKELKKKYKAQGHPNIYFFVGGVKVDSYTNARRRDAIVKWIKTKMAHGVYTITTIEQAEQVVMVRSTITLAFFESLQGLECEELAAASKLQTNVIFYQTTSADVAKAFQIDQETKSPALILLEKESQHLIYFNGPFTKYAIADFVSMNKLPPVTSFTIENAPLILKSSMQQLFVEDFMEDML